MLDDLRCTSARSWRKAHTKKSRKSQHFYIQRCDKSGRKIEVRGPYEGALDHSEGKDRPEGVTMNDERILGVNFFLSPRAHTPPHPYKGGWG